MSFIDVPKWVRRLQGGLRFGIQREGYDDVDGSECLYKRVQLFRCHSIGAQNNYRRWSGRISAFHRKHDLNLILSSILFKGLPNQIRRPEKLVEGMLYVNE